MNSTALETYLAPFQSIFSEDDVSEISINTPKEVWVERKGDISAVTLEELDFEHLKSLARLVAQSTDQKISEESPLLSAALPNGYRIQFVFPPACESGKVVLSIRKISAMRYDFETFEKSGAFNNVKIDVSEDPNNKMLNEYLARGEIRSFLSFAIKCKKNIIISGGTSTGKTTFTNAALMEIPSSERLITCEDTREVALPNHPNRVHLIASKGGQGRAKVTIQDLIEACLRLRPDRIIVGELRGSEAFSFLRAINTGHPGSIATLHADTPHMALEQLKLMVLQAGLSIPPSEIKEYIFSVVDIVVQLKRASGGMRYISDIYFRDKAVQKL